MLGGKTPPSRKHSLMDVIRTGSITPSRIFPFLPSHWKGAHLSYQNWTLCVKHMIGDRVKDLLNFSANQIITKAVEKHCPLIPWYKYVSTRVKYCVNVWLAGWIEHYNGELPSLNKGLLKSVFHCSKSERHFTDSEWSRV